MDSSLRVPMADLQAQLEPLRAEVEEAVLGVVRSGRYILGPQVEGLESDLGEFLGGARAIGVSSGTDALLVALMALGIGPGDRVLTSAYSFFATAGVIARLGATPVFIDIEPATYNLDVSAVATWLDEHPDLANTVKAVIPVHLFGQCADMDSLVELARARGIAIVEDAAQALGARYRGRMAGTLGEVGAFSFFPAKNLGALGDAGLVVTHSDDLARVLRKLRVHGAEPKYFHSLVGGNFRIDAIQAAALRVKLRHLDEWNRRRRANAERYDDAFASCPAIVTPAFRDRGEHIYSQYVLSVAERRDELRAALAASGIATAVFYPRPFHLQECFGPLGYSAGAFPSSEHAAEHSVAIPVYPEMSSAQQNHVIDQVLRFFN